MGVGLGSGIEGWAVGIEVVLGGSESTNGAEVAEDVQVSVSTRTLMGFEPGRL